ncbi:MAG: cation:proton antiporter [Maricaulaceae bacterium]
MADPTAMNPAEALLPAVALLGAGVFAIVACRAIKLSPIVGFLVGGALLGPYGFGVIADTQTVHLLAELGVVFLLFDIGLHFSLRDLREAKTDLLLLAPAQVCIAAIVFGALAFGVGLSLPLAGLAGGAAALSSTAVVARVINERGLASCPLGRSATSVLIFQDIIAIFLLVYAGAFDQAEAGLAPALGATFVKALDAIGLALTAGRWLLAPVLGRLARLRQDDAFTAGVLFLVLATAAATGLSGLSLTLGAFLAGMVIADTPYRHIIQTETEPFRALLMGFFFLSVGVGLDAPAIAKLWPWVLVAAAGLIVLKTMLGVVAALLSQWSRAGAIQLGFLLGQGSEFALVLLALPGVAVAFGPEPTALAAAAVAVTLAATPAWSALGMRLARKLAKRRPAGADDDGAIVHPMILIGMNPVGRLVADGLTAFDLPYFAIELDPDTFMEASAAGYSVVFGDAADLRLMDRLEVSQACALVITAPNFAISKAVTPTVRERWPDLARFAAVSSLADMERFDTLGIRPVLVRGEPQGAELVVELLRFSDIDDAAISDWLASVRPARPKLVQDALDTAA